MFIILNWWYGDLIANALPVMKEDGGGEAMLFKTRKEAQTYAKNELNGHYKIVED